MTLAQPLLYLPLLHKDMAHILPCHPPQAHAFCPGIPHGATAASHAYFTPEGYAFSPKEAAVCLKDIQSMGEAALSGVPLQAFMHPQKTRRELEKAQEQDDLENFIRTGQEPSQLNEPSIHERRQAQKILLWAWLMEEHLLEIQNLTENYTLGAAGLLSALGTEKDETLSGLEEIQNILSTDTFALPPWRLVLENMAVFLTPHSEVIINHPDMIDYIMEHRDTFALQSLSAQSKEKIGHAGEGFECTVSIAQLLSKKVAQDAAPWLEKSLHCFIIKD